VSHPAIRGIKKEKERGGKESMKGESGRVHMEKNAMGKTCNDAKKKKGIVKKGGG